jgi:hypothetical protein
MAVVGYLEEYAFHKLASLARLRELPVAISDVDTFAILVQQTLILAEKVLALSDDGFSGKNIVDMLIMSYLDHCEEYKQNVESGCDDDIRDIRPILPIAYQLAYAVSWLTGATPARLLVIAEQGSA